MPKVPSEHGEPTPILFAQSSREDLVAALEAALERSASEEERHLWASMLPDRRELTLKRIATVKDWILRPGEMTAAEAAELAKVKVSRWYEIVGAWKAKGTLAALGTFANQPGRRGPRLDGATINRIQAVLVPVIAERLAADAGTKIGTIVTALQKHPDLDDLDLPHVNTLRAMVEREVLRVRGEQQAGLRPGLDAVACDLLRPDGTNHVMFAVIDRTARYILGFSVGRVEDSLSAYARAAHDALRRIEGPDGGELPWADELKRVDVIVGDDVDAWKTVFQAHARHPIAEVFDPVISEKRYGRYFKLVAGSSVGKLRIIPMRTAGDGEAPTTSRSYSDAEAIEALEIDVARHNSAVRAASSTTGASRPAPALLRMLRFIASAPELQAAG
ncbi:hypothetical protein QE363_000692 [Sphingomonas sp. SORGH_AS870]|uniref:hypothetical protein n=1 Tax=Sphingomonas sp. SORGH_AS_0870 TaxID=3041801 RepID=UPI002862074D|nr:hypothetical protein [Sphingomonas sp. SORGH_AS_0870]MDR6144899.1 hypothetical protein [Sphingomonas sp. SORGH_AS_0870]